MMHVIPLTCLGRIVGGLQTLCRPLAFRDRKYMCVVKKGEQVVHVVICLSSKLDRVLLKNEVKDDVIQ